MSVRWLAAGVVVFAFALVFGCGEGQSPATPTPAPTPTPTPTPPTPTPTPPAPSPVPPECVGLLDVAFQGSNLFAGTGRAALTLRSSDPNTTELNLVRPYTIIVPEGGDNLDPPSLLPTVGVFVSELGFRQLGDQIEQTMMVEWLSGLEIEASSANCPPVTFTCTVGGCAPGSAG